MNLTGELKRALKTLFINLEECLKNLFKEN